MAKGKYTAFGGNIWHWEPFRKLESLAAKMVWIALYTTAESKRLPPGLWHGSIYMLAEAANLRPDDVLVGVDALLKAGMVEHDQGNRIIRMTMFPDHHERAANGNQVRGWWNRFHTLPECPIRNAHVRLLWWLLEQEPMSKDHHDAWRDTFANIIPPTVRRRGVQSLMHEPRGGQQSLFPVRDSSTLPVVLPNGLPTTEYEEVSPVSSLPEPLPAMPVDNSGMAAVGETSDREINNLEPSRNGFATVTQTVGSRSRSSSVSSSSPESGASGGGDLLPAGLRLVPAQPPPDAAQPSGRTVQDVIGALTGSLSTVVPREVQDGVQEAIYRTFGATVAASDMEALRAFRTQTTGTPIHVVLHAVRKPGALRDFCDQGREYLIERERRSSAMSEAMAAARRQAGV